MSPEPMEHILLAKKPNLIRWGGPVQTSGLAGSEQARGIQQQLERGSHMSLEQIRPILGRPMPQHYWVGGARKPNAWKAKALGTDGRRPSIGNSPRWATRGSMTLGLVYSEAPPGGVAPHRNLRGGDPLQRISWAVQNQNYQPTCIAHAVVAGLELILVASESPPVVQPLSARFLYHEMRNIGPGTIFRGARMSEWGQGFTSFYDANKALQRSGICLQGTWPNSGPLGDKPRQAGVRPGERIYVRDRALRS